MAIKSACGDLEGGSLDSATVISPPSISGSLFVTATVYRKSKQEGTASYFFWGVVTSQICFEWHAIRTAQCY